jgi:predicted metal-binding membrane protein
VTLARSGLFAMLAGLSVLCWGLSLRMAGAHVHGDLWPLFAMWSVMMVGMMVPVEAPSLLRLPVRQALPCLAGYLAPWIAFSFAAAALQSQLHHAGSVFAAALLIVAGAMQLSPWKRACLERAVPRVSSIAGFGLASWGALLL